MREISLHIIDLVENSIAAGATKVRIRIDQDHASDFLRITVEDDGSGLCVDDATAVDPFYTTKGDKVTGLGLSLLRAEAQRSGGELELGRSAFGGLSATATFRISHIDRHPLGDLACSVAAVACVNPFAVIECEITVDGRKVIARARNRIHPGERHPSGWETYGDLHRQIDAGMQMLGATQ